MLEQPIPKAGWARVAFGDVVRKVNDKVDPWDSGLERYVAGEHMDTDDLRIRRWGLIGDDYLGPAFHMRFKPGHVLYGSRRTYLRKVALAEFEGITANTTFVLETKDSARLMPELLPFLMQTEAFHSYSIKHSKGSVNPYINFSDLESFEFLLPPIQEQARLVEAFTAMDDLIETNILAEKLAKDVLHAFYKDCFSSAVPKISTRNACSFITSGSRGWAQYYADDGDTFFRITNMRRQSIRPDWSDMKYVNAPDTLESSRTLVEVGDVLTSITADIGLVTLADDFFPKCFVNQHVAILRPKTEVMLPGFLAHYLSSEFGYRELNKFNDHGAKAGLNLQNLADITVPKFDLSAQRDFLSKANSMVRSIEDLEARLLSLSLFRGHLVNSSSAEAGE